MIYLEDLREMDNSESSIGVIRKWYDEIHSNYVKASSYDKKNKRYHVEAIMECIAFEVGQLLSVDVVPYWLDKLYISMDEILDVCVSNDFKVSRKIQSSISANSYLLKEHPGITSRKERYDLIAGISKEVKLNLEKMILFDYLIDNHDRHMRNIELIQYKGVISLSPIFDNGSSLMSDWLDEDLEDILDDEDLFEEKIIYAETTSKAFANEHAVEIGLVDKETYKHINLNITKDEFYTIIEKYSDFLSPIRKQLINKLLTHRYENIKRRAAFENKNE